MDDKQFNAGRQDIFAGKTSDAGRPPKKVAADAAAPRVNCLLLSGLGLFASAAICAAGTSDVDLTELPIEKLMEMQVTILRGQEPLSKTPAAVSIVTQEDIRRSGATSIPEALRLVPGLEVARVDASQWAISARGFNDVFANKLLVLQDGRSIYSPVFSGVFWDVQGTMMEDIDQIEVIRGPGATLWGANAVNGVINIITKKAKNTQGVLASAGGGSVNRGFVNARYGGQAGANGFFRVYGTYFDHDNFPLRTGGDANDAWRMGRAGFRADWDLSDQNVLTVQGDGYLGAVHATFNTFDPANPPFYFSLVPDTMDVWGGNVLGRWTHTFSDTADLTVQAYYDRTEREAAIFTERRDTIDFDAQHRFASGERNEIVWGLGYRLTSDKVGGSPTITFTPSGDTVNLFSAFVQDEVTLVPDRLKLTLGTKLEHNDFTGFEVEPGARLLWTPNSRNTVWASVSRSVRTPSRSDDASHFNQVLPPNAVFPGSPPGVVTVFGTPDSLSEELMAYEIGYRVEPHDKLTLDFAAFYNVYDRLRSTEFGDTNTPPPVVPPPPPNFIIPSVLRNGLEGETYGFEAAATLELTSWWRVKPTYTFLDMNLRAKANSLDTTSASQQEGQNPQHQVSLHSSMDLPHNVSLNCVLRYVDRLPTFGIDSYLTADVRLAWKPTKNLELAVVGQDLLDRRHAEFAPILTQRTEVPRSVYAKVTWHF